MHVWYDACQYGKHKGQVTRGLGNERKWKANGKLDWIVRSSDNRSFKLCVWHYLPLFYHLLLCTNSLHLTGKFWKYLRKLWRCLLGNREMESKVYFLLRLGTSERLNGSVSAPFWPRKVGILKKRYNFAKKDIFQDSAFVSDVHLCSVHLVTRLGPVWHTFTTSCFVLLKEIYFQGFFFQNKPMYRFCRANSKEYCSVAFSQHLSGFEFFLKHEDASLIWPKCICKAPLRKRNSICMK